MQQETGLESSLGGAVVGVQGPRMGQSNRDPMTVGSGLCGKNSLGRGNGEDRGPEAGAWLTYSSKIMEANVGHREGGCGQWSHAPRDGPNLSSGTCDYVP